MNRSLGLRRDLMRVELRSSRKSSPPASRSGSNERPVKATVNLGIDNVERSGLQIQTVSVVRISGVQNI
jgi:hypothetical protein